MNSRAERNGTQIKRLIDQIRELYALLKHERLFKVFGVVCLIIIYGALAIFFADRYYQSKGTGGIFDALYWAVVTITTVGYGDIVPSSKVGKIFALIIILSGPALLSLITASIASILVERKIRDMIKTIVDDTKRNVFDFVNLGTGGGRKSSSEIPLGLHFLGTIKWDVCQGHSTVTRDL